MNYKLVPLCRCNNCMIVYEDANPQVGVGKFKVPESIPKLEKIDDMVACPECETDMYLSDIGLTTNAEDAFLVTQKHNELPILASLLEWCDKGIEQSKTSTYPIDKRMFIHFKSIIFRTMEEYFDTKNRN